MIYKKYFSLCIFFSFFSSLFSFQYDSAAQNAQEGKWDRAYEKLQSVLVDSPDSADVLYDAGVAAYNLEKFPESVAYFTRSANYCSDVDLKKRALFNAGNSCVSCDQLEHALKQYDAALILDSQDEYVKHNRDIVAQMLQQKQEKDNNKDQQSKDDQQKNEQEKKDNTEEQKNKDNQKSQQQDQKKEQPDNDQQDGQQDKGQEGENQQSDLPDQELNKKSQDKKGSNSSDGSNSSERTDERNTKEDHQDDRQNEQRDGNEKSENKFDNKQSERNGQQGDQHDNTPKDQKNSVNETNDASLPSQENKDQGEKQGSLAAAQQGEEEMAHALEQKINDPLLIRVLQQQEDRDKAMNKQLMQAKIKQNGGKNGQNSW